VAGRYNIAPNGIQNGAINMEDIVSIIFSYNSIKGEQNYNEVMDINANDAINMIDIVICLNISIVLQQNTLNEIIL